MQEMSLDYHFTVEQEVGSATHAFFGFNGENLINFKFVKIAKNFFYLFIIFKYFYRLVLYELYF